MKSLLKSAPVDELGDFTEVAEQRINRIGVKLRRNLIPPLFRDLPQYTSADFRGDLMAGLTIAALTIPQTVAFALLIGIPVPAVIGCALVGSVLCALYCSSRHLVFGPTNTISIILASALLALAGEPAAALEIVLLIGFLMGALQIAAGLADLGKITQFVSRSVIVGYSTGVGILIATGQVGHLLGVVAAGEPGLPGMVRHVATRIATLDFNPPTAFVGLNCLLLLLWLRRWRPQWPDGLITLTVAGLASWSLDLGRFGIPTVRDLGEIASGLPLFSGFPLNGAMLDLLPKVTALAIAAAVLGMLEAVTIAKSLATRTGQRIDPNQELIGMGLGNLIGAGFGAMPGSASFLRSSANLQAGGQTQWATIIGSGFVLMLVVVLAPLLAHIPIAAIAAYLIVIAIRLFQPGQIYIVRRATRSDALVFWLTLAATLFLELETAIYTGIGLSLVLFLQKASTPTLLEHAFNHEGDLGRIDHPDKRNHPQVSIVHVEGDLFFGAADLLQDGVRRLAEDANIRVIILRLKNARHLDATTVIALDQIHAFLASQGRHLLISGAREDVTAVLERSGLAEKIGRDHLFPAEENATMATMKALKFAQALIGEEPDIRLFLPNTS